MLVQMQSELFALSDLCSCGIQHRPGSQCRDIAPLFSLRRRHPSAMSMREEWCPPTDVPEGYDEQAEADSNQKPFNIEWGRPGHTDWTRDRWPIIPQPVVHVPAENLAAKAGRDVTEILDLRYMHQDKPRKRAYGEAYNPVWDISTTRWWHPPMALTGEAHDRQHARVRALLQEVKPVHPRANLVLQEWTTRFARTTIMWVQGLQEGDRDTPLLPACRWCGIPTGAWCEGTEDEICMAPVCGKCDATFGECCPACSWWMGLPLLRDEIRVAGLEVAEGAARFNERMATSGLRQPPTACLVAAKWNEPGTFER